jgi:hypothetical protein
MGGKDVEVNLDNIKLDIQSDTTIDADIKTDVKADIESDSNINIDTSNIRTELVLPQPLRTESNFAITEPIVSQNSSDIGLDIRPVVMDFCFKLEFGKLPPTCIRRPYSHHFGITLFGMEVLGFNFAGESDVIIDEVQKKPQIAWGEERAAPATHTRRSVTHVDSGGLQIRLGS